MTQPTPAPPRDATAALPRFVRRHATLFAVLVIGLAVGPIMFTIGMVGLAICLVEWAVRSWSDRATGDPEVNRSIRNRFMQPVEIPALAVIGIAGMVLAVSRILLALPKIGSYLVFGLVPALSSSKPELGGVLGDAAAGFAGRAVAWALAGSVADARGVGASEHGALAGAADEPGRAGIARDVAADSPASTRETAS